MLEDGGFNGEEVLRSERAKGDGEYNQVRIDLWQ